eukprot:106055-Pleurochrysis_carterae.AAC.4
MYRTQVHKGAAVRDNSGMCTADRIPQNVAPNCHRGHTPCRRKCAAKVKFGGISSIMEDLWKNGEHKIESSEKLP